jgi:hypothetical protein
MFEPLAAHKWLLHAFCEHVVSGLLLSTATAVLAALQFIADGVFFAELNELLTRELAEDGYSGVEVRVTPMRTEIIIRATRTQNVLGEQHAAVAAGSRVAQLQKLAASVYRLVSLEAFGAWLDRRRSYLSVAAQQQQQW